MDKMEQLRAFVQFERDNSPGKAHIADWALSEIERLSTLAAPAQQRPKGMGATDPRCAGCDLPNGCPEYCWCGPDGAMRRDAARYRWLRDRNDWYAEPRLDEKDGTRWKLVFYSPQQITDPSDDDNLDAAVDAATAPDSKTKMMSPGGAA